MSHHRIALIVVAATLLLDVLLGFAYAMVTPHLSVLHGLYCALANAVTIGGDVAPVNGAGYAVQAAECLTVLPLGASFGLFTSGLTATHVKRAEKNIKAHISSQTGETRE